MVAKLIPCENIEQLVDRMDEPNRRAIWSILGDNLELFRIVQGSSSNHQAWPGGYIDHVTEVMNLAVVQHAVLDRIRPLPFSLSDALVVLFLHDIEKPWKYRLVDGRTEIVPELLDKQAQHVFRADKLKHYGIVLTDVQANAMRYVEGEHKDYSSDRRVMNELAAFCHVCDVLSARVWHAHPLAENDPWLGSGRRR